MIKDMPYKHTRTHIQIVKNLIRIAFLCMWLGVIK